ncbi:helix-turn-helix domain-containing protein [Streptomyces sp. HUAS MG91]|uniref:Helix-turn-helix domain-containing protein n=1 Tax=Streptomyces tabacisoli TaxID=3156398 RepID=A0AAU8IL78_9ACTN
MTIELITRRPMPSHPRRSDGQAPLPAPEERSSLRRAWRLTEEQVAEAFGVTAATVRSWEAGRSAPRGRRRAAYAAFLSGLAHGLVPGPSTESTPPPAQPPAPRPARVRSSAAVAKAAEESTAASTTETVLRGAAPSTPGRPVGRAPDPVSPARLRGFRRTTAAVAMWIAFGHLMATAPLPHL